MDILRIVILIIIDISFSFGVDPPLNWQEHWFEHNQNLTRVYFDDEVAIYFDSDVDNLITWPFKFLHDVWYYTKSVYGTFGDDRRLFAIFHTDKYGGGHPSTYFDKSHDYRNVIDCGSYNSDAWQTVSYDEDLTDVVAFIVETASYGVHESPAFPIWKNGKWGEIFTYDVYRALNLTKKAQKYFDEKILSTDNYPKANTHWFRDWFYPIYNKYGGSTVLNKFFLLLSQHFPKASYKRSQYSRSMNHGEFFHFWSGAANENLKNLAIKAFCWNKDYENQFQQAQVDFPQITY